MRPLDFVAMVAICLVWGMSTVISKIVVSDWGIPPLFFAALRFSIVMAVTLPWLLPMPRPRLRVVLVGFLMGAGNFALSFMALMTSPPSAVGIVMQIGVPFTTLLSVLMLGERIHWRRGAGMAMTLAGVLIVLWHPGGLSLAAGLWFAVAAAFAGSLGSVLMKQITTVAPLRFQAWVGLVSCLPLMLGSAATESGQWTSALAVGWPFVAALAFTAIIVSVVAHTGFYWLIRRYEANLLAPLTLMTPISTIVFGVMLTGDQLDLRLIAGTALALLGVLVVAVRSKTAPVLVERERG